MSEVTITAMGERRFGVQTEEGHVTTSHVVAVPGDLLDDLQLADDDQERLIRESFQFLLEREPATSIMGEFSLHDIERFFPDYREEITRRLV
jgi:hypothetical protein